MNAPFLRQAQEDGAFLFHLFHLLFIPKLYDLPDLIDHFLPG
ncbi:MAG: hypothetical protein K0S33_3778 [Bacteroidetes bacterium]|jgi:hypothetical protein|nr:hypothetical protein [Bacteroidota bacterium]